MLTERVSELNIPLMATYWSRQFAQQNWMLSGGFGEPVFNYLYHDYITTIAAAMVQGQGINHPGYMLRRAVIADSLCRGLILGPFDSDISVHPPGQWQANISSLFFNVSQAYVPYREYVSLGQLIRPPSCGNCSVVSTFMFLGSADSPTQIDINISSVRLGGFQAGGAIAVFAINILDQATTVTLDLSLYQQPRYLNGTLSITLATLDGSVVGSIGQVTQVTVTLPAISGRVFLIDSVAG